MSTQYRRPHIVHKNLPLFLSALSFLFIAAGLLSIYFLQIPLQNQNFDTRKAAAVDTGLVTLTATFQDVSVNNLNAHFALLANTHGVQTDGVQVIFNVITSVTDNFTISVPTSSGLHAVHQEVEKTNDGFLVSLITVPDLGKNFVTNQDTVIATFDFKPQSAGQIRFAFDEGNSLATVHGSNPPKDELKTVPQFTFTTTGPAVIASPTPSPTPNLGGSCNTTCSSNQDCGVNLRCYNQQCRLAINVTSDTCSSPADLGLQRQCNEYCADTKECASGYTCFYNKCRRPENPDNASCAALSTTSAQAIAKTCNITCDSNRDCGVNLRCYNRTCRLATNVSSLSCSPQTYRTVSMIYQTTSGTKGEEIPLPSASPSTATTAGNTVADQSPVPSIKPSSSPAAVTNLAESLFGQMGSSLARIAIVAGIMLLLLALLALLLNRPRKEETIQNRNLISAPSTPVENKLAERIKELQQQQAPPAATIASTPIFKSVPITPTPVVPTPAPAPIKPIIATKVTTPVASVPPASPASSTMMQKIKDKGLDKNIPQPV